MEYYDKEYCLEVAGDFACFTRPEFKVERVSYDIITPSAVRAIFEAIFWKPAIKWQPTKVEVLEPMNQWFSIRRNEVSALASTRTKEIFIEDKRQLRGGKILRNVRYRIYAKLVFIPVRDREETQDVNRDNKDENPGKYQAIFERRAKKGQVFNQPYLGCREFSCSTCTFVEDSTARKLPISETKDLGYMLYDLDFSDPDNPEPAFFRAQVEDGVMTIPPWESEEVIR